MIACIERHQSIRRCREVEKIGGEDPFYGPT